MTIVVLRPNEDGSTIWPRSTGSTMFNLLNDDSDTTYINNPGTKGTTIARLGMGTTTLSADQRVKAVRLRYRNKYNGAGWLQGGLIRFGITQTLTTLGQVSAAGSIHEKSGPWWSSDGGGNEWVQHSLDSMGVRFYEASNMTTADRMRVYEVYVDVDINNRPTTTTPTVTGNTTTSQPTFAWTYSDSDNDIHTRSFVKIFTSAQYSATGFSPDTTTPIWQKEILGPVLTIKPDINLVSGFTYRFYVKVAHAFRNSHWYSAWQNVQFSQSTGVPNTPFLTTEVDNTNQGVALIINAVQNQMTAQQSSLEDTTTTGWVNNANATLSNVTNNPVDGTRVLQLASVAAGDMSARSNPSGTGGFPVRPGFQYTARAVSRAVTVARQSRASILWYDAGGLLIQTSDGSLTTNSTSAGTTHSVTVTNAPDTAVTAAVLLSNLATGGAGEQHRWDAISFHTGAHTTFFLGGQIPTSYALFEQYDLPTGPGNQSHPNVASNGDIYQNTEGFYARFSTVTYDRRWSNFGAGSIRWRPSTFDFLDIGTSNSVSSDKDVSRAFVGITSQTYTLSLYARASQSFTAKLSITPIAVDGDFGGTPIQSTNQTITTSWQRFTLTGTLPSSGFSWIRMGLSNENAINQTTDIWVANIQWELGPTATEWRPGNNRLEPEWVRTRSGKQTISPANGQEITMRDFEIRDIARAYRVRIVNEVDANTITSSGFSNITTACTNDGFWWLKDPLDPSANFKIRATAMSQTIHENVQVYRPIGREKSVAASDGIFGEDGELTVMTIGPVERQKLYSLVRRQRTYLLQSPFTGEQWYIRFTSRATSMLNSPPDRLARTLVLPYVEVDRPDPEAVVS